MAKNVLILGESTLVDEFAEESRKESHVVGDAMKNSCVGIVTEKDILYRIVAGNGGSFKITKHEHTYYNNRWWSQFKGYNWSNESKLYQAIASHKGLKVVGMLTLRSIVDDSLKRTMNLAEVEPPVDIPFSRIAHSNWHSESPSKEELSRHIGRLDLWSGLLEGDLSDM